MKIFIFENDLRGGIIIKKRENLGTMSQIGLTSINNQYGGREGEGAKTPVP